MEIKEFNGLFVFLFLFVIKLCVFNYNLIWFYNGDEKFRIIIKNMELNVVLCKYIVVGFVFSVV